MIGILKLQFKNGRLHDQSIFTIENKLKCIMDFEDSTISVRYAIFDNFKRLRRDIYIMFSGKYKYF